MEGSPTPKYLKLKQEILSWIFSGKIKTDDCIPSEHELASLFGISRHTVRQAIGEMVKDNWLYRIHGKGTFVKNNKINKENNSKTIGLITTYISDYIFPLIIRGAESTLRNNGYRLLLASTDNDKKKERQSLEMMMEYPLSGLIIEPTKSALENQNHPYYLQLEYNQIPYIMINETYPELNCPCLKVDDTRGGFLAAEHLIQLGHRRIGGFFKTDDLQGVNRMKGFIKAHQEYGVQLSSYLLHQYNTESKGVEPLKAAFSYLKMEKRPTAFVCYNDQLAIQILEIVRQAGINVPDQLSIVGFDDSNLATASEVKLTSLFHPKIDFGILAAERLMDVIENKDKYNQAELLVEQPRLVVRQSTKKVIESS